VSGINIYSKEDKMNVRKRYDDVKYSHKSIVRWVKLGYRLKIYKQGDFSDRNIDRILKWIDILKSQHIKI
jgi:hypothetical protein